ncbi:hypothetical protein ABFS83_04G163500 [Erythranthe nasuta]
MGKSFKTFLDQLNLGKFPQFIIFAVLEWTMILLLFADGLIAFVSNEFAKFFGLETPCLLCTRIDHILVKRNSSFYYNDSICGAHKKDVSSLAYCRIHDKLSDIRNMCQGCLLSFATEKDADCDKYKSLVGILHKDFDCFVDDEDRKKSSAVKRVDGSGGGGGGGGDDEDDPRCSCCGEIVKLKLSSKYIRSLSMKAPVSSPRASWLANGRNNVESPRTRYAELKFMSETGRDVSEVDASNNAYNHGKEAIKSLNAPSLLYSKDINEDACRTPIFARRSKFFPMPLNSAPVSPRVWLNNGLRKLSVERGGAGDMIGDPTNNNNEDDVENSNPPNEVDIEILNRLKKQVRLDNKSLMALYMELDEERSASNVAANNAMAMITRLQAEKAAVQMEALQYQRMMEEQAEYDEEAIQVMRDELSRRDEDVAALEYELEVYREKYGVVVNKIGGEICEVADGDNYYYQDGNNHDETSLLDFEGEKSHLLGVLNDLEKKLNVDEGSTIMHEDEGKQDNKATITREISLIKERLRALEEDSGFLQHAAMTMQRGENGTKLLTEIAQHLRKVRHSVKSSSDDIDE